MVRIVYCDAFMKMGISSMQLSCITGHSFVGNGVLAVLKLSMLEICVGKGYPVLSAKSFLSHSVNISC